MDAMSLLILFVLFIFWGGLRVVQIILIWTIAAGIDKVANALANPTPEPGAIAHSFTVIEPETGLTIEGAAKMNLKNNRRVVLKARFKNKQQGPAAIQKGSAVLENTNTTGAYTATQDPDDETKVIVEGNPQSEGNDQDVGIVRLTVDGDAGEGVKSLVCEIAINVTPGDAEIAEFGVESEEDQ